MKKYELIYVDPPWRYRSGKVQGAAINHYATMSDEELYQLPVAKLRQIIVYCFCGQPFQSSRKPFG